MYLIYSQFLTVKELKLSMVTLPSQGHTVRITKVRFVLSMLSCMINVFLIILGTLKQFSGTILHSYQWFMSITAPLHFARTWYF